MLRTKSVWSPIHRKTDGLRILATRFRGSDDDFLYARDVIGGNTGFHRASRTQALMKSSLSCRPLCVACASAARSHESRLLSRADPFDG